MEIAMLDTQMPINSQRDDEELCQTPEQEIIKRLEKQIAKLEKALGKISRKEYKQGTYNEKYSFAFQIAREALAELGERMICPKCKRQMDKLHLLKRYKCYYCDYTVHYEKVELANNKDKG